jgi:hypothetical protein
LSNEVSQISILVERGKKSTNSSEKELKKSSKGVSRTTIDFKAEKLNIDATMRLDGSGEFDEKLGNFI